MARPELSVVIPVYNNWWLTARCLRELDVLRTESAVAFETIVVDNASSDETPAAIAQFPWARYVRHQVNENFAGACNAGARAAQTPLTFFLNNDAYPLGDSFPPLVRAFDRSDVAIAGGALFFEDGVTQAAGLVMLPNDHWHYSCRNLPSSLGEVNRSRDALGISGAAMAVRTGWFLDADGFDTAFVNGFEDVDLCMRAHEQGRAIVYVPDSRFAHYEAASENRFARELENERLFHRRWSAKLAAFPRTLRGDVGAIAVRNGSNGDPLLAAALEDLQDAVRAFGHPIVRDRVPAWRTYDRRFRRAATLAWFCQTNSPGVSIHGDGVDIPAIRTLGATDVSVPFLPCASPQRLELLGIVRSEDAECRSAGVLGNEADFARLQAAASASSAGVTLTRITPGTLLGKDRYPVACVVHLGLSDASAFGNVLLAQAGIPAIVAARGALPALFQEDVALIGPPADLMPLISRMCHDPSLRTQYGARLAGDAKRRYSPRRSAIRVVDLLCAARFGLERSAVAEP
ncbi:MAG: glycosyltransferase [Candidatus Eremiobacteraeota bacterium]|nr:glycosyltransferase [Candidatus Eremiobacteraeota bacterium]MBV9264312.1 glycosyltransferase [Candidatus Eremiobacteraeota bacterium]